MLKDAYFVDALSKFRRLGIYIVFWMLKGLKEGRGEAGTGKRERESVFASYDLGK